MLKKNTFSQKAYLFLSGFLDPILTDNPLCTIRKAKALPKSPLPMIAMESPDPEMSSEVEDLSELRVSSPESIPELLDSNRLSSTLFWLLEAHMIWVFYKNLCCLRFEISCEIRWKIIVDLTSLILLRSYVTERLCNGFGET